MNKNFEFLNSFTKVSEKAFKKLQNISSYTKIKKGDTIARAGEKATNIHLLVAGVMRAYYYDEAGKQYNKKLFVANSFVGALTSLIVDAPSQMTYQALSDCKLFEIDFVKFKALCKTEIEISNLYCKTLEFIFIQYERRNLELMSLDATERYLKLKERIPDIDDLIPQFHIASYLNVTPVQLSRIRKKMVT